MRNYRKKKSKKKKIVRLMMQEWAKPFLMWCGHNKQELPTQNWVYSNLRV